MRYTIYTYLKATHPLLKMSLLYLRANDFKVVTTEAGPMLHNVINGFSLILFYSPRCQHCQTFIPKFKSLPSIVNGCQFGIIDISQNRNVVEVANKSTITPIPYVPLLILYLHGKPYAKYEGNPATDDIMNIRQFVLGVANEIQQSGFLQQGKKGKEKPPYSVGIPLMGEDVTDIHYLEFSKDDPNGYVSGRK